MAEIKAIDVLNYYRYTKEGLAIFVGGPESSTLLKTNPPEFFRTISTEEFIKEMDEASYEKVFLAAIKMGSYRARAMNMDYNNEMIYEETKKFPDRLVGIAGYDPLNIMESVRQIEKAAKEYGFKGVYAHTISWGMTADDRRMYPCYAKCVELDIPFSMQIGQSWEPLPVDVGRPIYVDKVVVDFPELRFICSHTGYPWHEEVVSLAWSRPNIYIDIAAHFPRTLPVRMKALVDFMDSRAGRNKVLFGTNSFPLKPYLDQFMALPISEETKLAVLRENAIRVFKL